MNGKNILSLAMVLVTFLIAEYYLTMDTDDETQLDQETAELAQSNSTHIIGLRDDIQRLTKALENSQAKPGSAGVNARDVERIVKQALANRSNEPVAESMVVEDEEVAAISAEQEFNFNSTMASLIANPADWDARQMDWARIKKAGKMDEAIAFLEERAKDAANNPEAHCDLAEGYIAKLQTAGTDFMMMARLADKADKSFDKTLEIDDQHWRGRLQKAISLSFAPAIAGKQGEAIKHFKILAEQQESQTPRRGHAMTHMYLGNMYAQQGKSEEAQAAWKKGLTADPENAQLKKLLSNAGN